jgi:hypothetical protein
MLQLQLLLVLLIRVVGGTTSQPALYAHVAANREINYSFSDRQVRLHRVDEKRLQEI